MKKNDNYTPYFDFYMDNPLKAWKDLCGDKDDDDDDDWADLWKSKQYLTNTKKERN
jgi:hypothetical protein